MNLELNISDIFSKKVIGISVVFQGNEKHLINGLVVDLKKKEVVVEELYQKADSLESFIVSNEVNHPVCLILNGKGVIHKQASKESFDSGSFFQDIFPQADRKDFFVQAYYLENGDVSLSLIRSSLIKEITDLLSNKKIHITRILLGNELLINLSEMLIRDGVIKGLSQNLNIKEGRILSVEKNHEPGHFLVDVDGHDLDIAGQLSLSTAIEHFSPDPSLISDRDTYIEKSTTKYRKKRIRKAASLVTASISFLILLINSWFFISLREEVDILHSATIVNDSYLKKAEQLKNDIFFKRTAISKMDARPHSFSFYSDRIASIIPESVLLNEMTLCPIKKSQSKKQFSEFESSRITIEGLVGQNDQLHDFIKELNARDWVKEAKLLSLDKKDDGKQSEFLLNIYLK